MKRVVGLMALLILVLTVTPAAADFYVIAGGGRLGTAITALPYTITSPGLYYLTNNLTSSGTNNNAITVNADDVTIDLMGFRLTGPGKTSGGNNGVIVAGNRTNAEIRNGSITAFGTDGIQGGGLGNSHGTRVVGLRVSDTGRYGICLAASDQLVMDCTVRNTGNACIYVGSSSLVKGSHVAGGWTGITAATASAVVGNTVRGCSTSGIYVPGTGATVLDNVVFGSAAYGIEVAAANSVVRNSVSGSTLAGIHTDTYCTITNNTTDGLTNGANCILADNCVTP